MSCEVIRTENFVSDAAEFVLRQARTALAERDEFRLALSGGNTPRPVYSEIARIARDLPWEQCVPPEHAESNFRMARELLLAPLSLPEKTILRMRGEIDPQLAAQEYEDQLNLLATQRGEFVYRHDLVLLGLGDDGHTASLFAGTAALAEQTRKVVANFVPKFNAWRLTMTLPMINQARHVCFLVNSNKHAALIERVLGGDHSFPASHVKPANGELTWI
jgi:6-phosphogluconolactonase